MSKSSGDILVVGASGMLGRACIDALTGRGLRHHAFAGRDELDITEFDQVAAILADVKPSTVINAAAFSDVDGAEDCEDDATLINGDGVRHLADACRAHDARLVHISTDYLFNGQGDTPWREEDQPDPLSAYGRSKLAGERAIIESGCRSLIIRTSWLFAPHGRNFVRTILRLARERDALRVVDDQRGRPTYAPDLAGWIVDLSDGDTSGIIHAANSGQCSWFELAREIVAQAAIHCEVAPCTSDEFPRQAKRPTNSVLDLTRLNSILRSPRPWHEALAECLRVINDASTATDVTHATQ